MGKFKIGDRVRLTDECEMEAYGLSAGDEGIVLENSTAPFIKWDRPTRHDWAAAEDELELVPTFTIAPGKFYRTRNGKVTCRVSKGDAGFEAVVDGKVRIYDEAGGHVHGGADLDIVEAWVPKVGERVRRFKGHNPGSLVGHEAVVRKLEDISHCDSEGPWLLFEDETSGYATSFEPLPVAAEAQPAAAMKIEAGRYYKTRDGRKVRVDHNPHYDSAESDSFPWKHDCGYGGYHGLTETGTSCINHSGSDLIAEWQDTPAAPVSAQVDTLAEEYGPAPNDRKLVRTGQGYGYELARFGDYVWVDTGKTAPITLRADKIAA